MPRTRTCRCGCPARRGFDDCDPCWLAVPVKISQPELLAERAVKVGDSVVRLNDQGRVVGSTYAYMIVVSLDTPRPGWATLETPYYWRPKRSVSWPTAHLVKLHF